MDYMDAGDDFVSLWLSGSGGEDTDSAQAARMIRRIRSSAGLPPWKDMEADCFQAGDQLLILARPLPPRPCAFFFPDLEALLHAVLPCPPDDSALYTADSGYLLVFPQKPAHLSLYEFGCITPLPPDWEIHAREQGQCLFPKNAIAGLLLAYSTKGL